MNPESTPKPPDRSRRAAILAAAGIVAILGLAVFCVAVVAPLWETHIVVRGSRRDSSLRLTRKAVLERLGGPERAAARLRTYLCLPHWMKTDRYRATYLLGWCGPLAVPELIRTLGDTHEDMRVAAAWALGKIGAEAKEAVPALAKALGDSDAGVRHAVALALGSIGPAAKEGVPALVAVLGDTDERVRRRAAYALGEIGPEAKAAVPALVRALSDAKRSVREHAAWALGRIGPPAKDAISALEKLLDDSHEHVRIAAAAALKRIRGSVPAPDAPEEAP